MSSCFAHWIFLRSTCSLAQVCDLIHDKRGSVLGNCSIPFQHYWPMVLKMSNWPLWQKGTQKKSSKSKNLFRLLIFKSQTLKHFQYFSYCILYTSIDIMLRGTLSQLHKGFHLGVNLRTHFSHFCCLTVLVWQKSKVLRGHPQSHTVLYTHKSPW